MYLVTAMSAGNNTLLTIWTLMCMSDLSTEWVVLLSKCKMLFLARTIALARAGSASLETEIVYIAESKQRCVLELSYIW